MSLTAASGFGQNGTEGAQAWIKLTTPGLELYTDTTVAKANDLLNLFEGAESASLRARSTSRSEAAKTLRIIAFANRAEYAPFRLKEAALGHYLHTGDHDYVVLADTEPEHYEAAVHEYTHYAVNRAGFHLPVWLNEGIADLYSTTSVKIGTPLLGASLPGRVSTLAGNHLLPVRELFAAERTSWLYNDAEKAPLFYAESWALTRLLALDGRYAPQFPELLEQLSAGSSSEDALWNTYRRRPEQFEAELPEYIRQLQGGRLLPVPAEISAHHEPEQMTVSDFDRRLIWADLLAAYPSTAASAKQRLLELEQQFPGQPQTEELLGHIAWASKHSEEARHHWTKAVEGGSRDFETLYRLALLLHENGAASSEVITLMEKAVGAKPDCDEAVYNLGLLKYGEGQYEDASQTLLRLHNVAPERAYTYYSVLAYCQMKMKTFGRAKASLVKAGEFARTAEEQAENSRMMRFAAARADQNYKEISDKPQAN